MEIKNAKIKKTSLDIERVFTAWIHLEFPSGGQSFGGYYLGGEWGCQFIRKVMETVGVERWEDLPGKYVRIEHDWGKVYRIGNITEDKWFDPEKDLVKFLPENQQRKVKSK